MFERLVAFVGNRIIDAAPQVIPSSLGISMLNHLRSCMRIVVSNATKLYGVAFRRVPCCVVVLCSLSFRRVRIVFDLVSIVLFFMILRVM